MDFVLSVLSVSLILLLVVIFNSLYIVEEKQAIIIERLGRFYTIASAGLNIKNPLLDSIKGYLNLKITQLDVAVETKTLDNVFVHLIISVQYKVIEKKAFEAFYTLDNPSLQMQSYVYDAVRAKVPKLILDDVFSKKNEIADEIQHELESIMEEFGFKIIKALLTDINPDSRVKKAMNEINEAQRLRAASEEKAQAEKITIITHAQAQAESKRLQGKGIADQREEIINGLKKSLEGLKEQADKEEAMLLLVMSQYLDTLREMSLNGTVFFNNSPSNAQDIMNQLRQTLIESNTIKEIKTKS